MRIKRKILLLLIAITIIPLMFGGCYDLGDAAEDDEDYCNLFPEVKFIDAQSSAVYYSMEDFYNKEAVNDFKTPMEESDRKEYAYILIEVDKDISVGNIAVFFDSTLEETLSVSFFILDEDNIPSKIYTGEGGKYKLDECDEPSDDLVAANCTCHLDGVADKWTSLFLRKWGVEGDQRKSVEVKEGQYLVLRIDNNCYDRAQLKVDQAKAALDKATLEYEQKRAEWQIINGGSYSQAEKTAAMDAMSLALQAVTVAEKDYEVAVKERGNSVPLRKLRLRVTSILIYAN